MVIFPYHLLNPPQHDKTSLFEVYPPKWFLLSLGLLAIALNVIVGMVSYQILFHDPTPIFMMGLVLLTDIFCLFLTFFGLKSMLEPSIVN